MNRVHGMRYFVRVAFPDGSTAEGFIPFEGYVALLIDACGGGWTVMLEDVAA